jgi:hypothetical protein
MTPAMKAIKVGLPVVRQTKEPVEIRRMETRNRNVVELAKAFDDVKGIERHVGKLH